MKLPAKMPDWWPEPGYMWARNPPGVTSKTLILLHPNHPRIIWNHNEDGEWDFMRELKL